MTGANEDIGVEPTVSVTIRVPRKHARAIRASAGDVDSTLQLLSETSRAVFRAIKALPAKACEVSPTVLPQTTTSDIPSSKEEEHSQAEDDEEFEVTIQVSDNLLDRPPAPETLTYKRPFLPWKPARKEKFTVSMSTTVEDLAQMVARRVGCSTDVIDLFTDELLMWHVGESPYQKVLPPRTSLGAIGVRKGMARPQIRLLVKYDQKTCARLEAEMVRLNKSHLFPVECRDPEVPTQKSDAPKTVPRPDTIVEPMHEATTPETPKKSTDPALQLLHTLKNNGMEKSAYTRPWASPYLEDNATYSVNVNVWSLLHNDKELVSVRSQRFVVQASTTLGCFTEMIATRTGYQPDDQALCFNNYVLRSFMQDFEPTVGSDDTLESLGIICSEEKVHMIHRIPETSLRNNDSSVSQDQTKAPAKTSDTPPQSSSADKSPRTTPKTSSTQGDKPSFHPCPIGPCPAGTFNIRIKVIYEFVAASGPIVREKRFCVSPSTRVGKLVSWVNEHMMLRLPRSQKTTGLMLNGKTLLASKTVDEVGAKAGAVFKMSVDGAVPKD